LFLYTKEETRRRYNNKLQEYLITMYIYKIYAEVIRYRLKKEMETKGLIPKNQIGFRRGKSTT